MAMAYFVTAPLWHMLAIFAVALTLSLGDDLLRSSRAKLTTVASTFFFPGRSIMFALKPVAGLFTLALCATVANAQAPAPRTVEARETSFTSGGKVIRLEVFAPKGDDKVPAIVLVPESKSLDEVGVVYRGAARLLAERGYLVALIHVFDRTGHKKGVDPKKINEEDFRAWKETVADGFCHIRDKLDRKRVKKEDVGLLGFSLGGFLALSAATDKELGVTAVASYFGGIPDQLWPDVRHLPPTLLIHGRKDAIVSVRHSLAVHGFCGLNKIPHECKIYDEGHMFEGALTAYVLGVRTQHLLGIRKGKFDPAAAIIEALRKEPTVHDAVGRGLSFFDRHLKRVKPPIEGAPEKESQQWDENAGDFVINGTHTVPGSSRRD
jgi:carboxymethylenebutenolidase